MSRPTYVYALAVVGAFAALGAGVGLAANFTIGFFIEQFVEPGQSPMDSIQVGMMLLVAIFLSYALGPVAAGVAGVGVGQAMPDRELTAGVVSGAGSFVGFYPFVGLSLFLTFSVLGEYGAGPSGGGGGGGGPLDPAGLLPLMVQVSLPVGLVGLATGYLTSRVSGGSTDRDEAAEEVVDGDASVDDAGADDGDVVVDDEVPVRREDHDEDGGVAARVESPADG
jgi:hypothetical protein